MPASLSQSSSLASSPQSPEAIQQQQDRAYQLLVYCLGCYLQGRPLDLANTPWAHDPPWQLMFNLARYQGGMSLLYRILEAEPSGSVPAPLLTALKQAAQQQVAISMQLIQALAQVIRLLERHDIAVISYKGPMLAQVVYGDMGLRRFSDLDLWVAPQDFLRARQLLIDEGGYEIVDRTWTFLTPRAEEAFFQEEGECALNKGIVHVDLHCRLAPSYFLGESLVFTDFWSRSIPVACMGLNVHTLSPEDRLVYLCIHGSKEHWRSLKWLMDLAMALKNSPELNWDGVMQRSQQWRCERMVMLGLRLISEVFALPLPEGAQPLLARARADTKVSGLMQQLQPGRASHPEASPLQACLALKRPELWSPLRKTSFQMACLGHWGDRWRYGLHGLRDFLVPNSQDRAFLPLPPALFTLYYGIRPFRLLFKK